MAKVSRSDTVSTVLGARHATRHLLARTSQGGSTHCNMQRTWPKRSQPHPRETHGLVFDLFICNTFKQDKISPSSSACLCTCAWSAKADIENLRKIRQVACTKEYTLGPQEHCAWAWEACMLQFAPRTASQYGTMILAQ